MRVVSQFLLTGVVLSAAGLFSAAPASAAVISCSASLNVDDSDVRVQTTTGPGNCALGFTAPPAGSDASNVSVVSRADSRFIVANALADVQSSHFVGVTGAASAFDQVRVSGLDVGGADITFSVIVNYILSADASDPNPFTRATATGFFFDQFTVSADGRGATTSYSGCVKNDTPGISVCNGFFDVTNPGVGFAPLRVTIHLENDDLVNINLRAVASSVGHAPQSDNFALARTTTFLTWGGVRFGPAGLRLLNRDGVDFTQPFSTGVPEPATWALMIAGFGAAGAMLRRRRAVLV